MTVNLVGCASWPSSPVGTKAGLVTVRCSDTSRIEGKGRRAEYIAQPTQLTQLGHRDASTQPGSTVVVPRKRSVSEAAWARGQLKVFVGATCEHRALHFALTICTHLQVPPSHIVNRPSGSRGDLRERIFGRIKLFEELTSGLIACFGC
jgi:hypothetical protein